jgi:DNA-binding CsgD family transcriptional regulator
VRAYPRFLGIFDPAWPKRYCRQVASNTTHRQTIDKVARICDAHEDARALRVALIEEIRRIVDFDAYAWLLTDPETEVGSAPVADVPWLAELPRQIRLKYMTPVNRWTTLDRPVGLLRAATGDRLERSLVWRELLVNYAVTDAASLVFRDSFGCWAFLELWRIDPAPPFTEADARFLSSIAPKVTDGLRRCQARTFEIRSPESERSGPIVLVLSAELEVKAQTPETDEYLRILIPTDADRRPIPAAAYNVAAQLTAVESGIDDHQPSVRVHLMGGLWLTLRAARMGGSRRSTEQDVAVTIEPTSPTERMTLFARACGLSIREAELFEHLASGADTRAIAERMFVSEHTIQDHLKSIFAKTGTHTRAALLARAAGR